MDTDNRPDFSSLSALFINTTLTRSPGLSHTQLLIDASASIMSKQGVGVDQFRSVDHTIASGVYPDMREHGWPQDGTWPELFDRVLAADILVIAGPIWLGDNSSETKKVIERLYAHSGELNDKGQWLYYGKVGGCLITGNEDGIKHCASNVPLQPAAHRLLHRPPVRCRMDRRSGAWTQLRGCPRGWQPGRPGQRVHQPQHHVHDVEPPAPRRHARSGRRLPGVREPTSGMGRRVPVRFPESRVPLVTGSERP